MFAVLLSGGSTIVYCTWYALQYYSMSTAFYVFTGHFLQHQELPDVPVVDGRCGFVNRRLGNIRGIQVSH